MIDQPSHNHWICRDRSDIKFGCTTEVLLRSGKLQMDKLLDRHGLVTVHPWTAWTVRYSIVGILCGELDMQALIQRYPVLL